MTRICIYDRAGLGASSALAAAATSRDAARDLNELLAGLEVQPPYVMVGHSLGGMDAIMFAMTYPDAVAGMVLIDSAHPDQQRKFAEVLPPRDPTESHVLQGYRDGPSRPVNGEWFNFRENSRLMRKLPSLGDKPLIVLTRDPTRSTTGGLVPLHWEQLTEPVWQKLQNQLATLSSNSKHVIVERSGHAIQYENPEVVTRAILETVERVRDRAQH